MLKRQVWLDFRALRGALAVGAAFGCGRGAVGGSILGRLVFEEILELFLQRLAEVVIIVVVGRSYVLWRFGSRTVRCLRLWSFPRCLSLWKWNRLSLNQRQSGWNQGCLPRSSSPRNRKLESTRLLCQSFFVPALPCLVASIQLAFHHQCLDAPVATCHLVLDSLFQVFQAYVACATVWVGCALQCSTLGRLGVDATVCAGWKAGIIRDFPRWDLGAVYSIAG